MWQRISHPDILIYLHASFATCTDRRRLSWRQADYAEQLQRLAHARLHADLVIETDTVTRDEVAARAIRFLEQK
jgi:chloramphenicol 3-O-phosphotransferase